ncbi:hypothetical protein HPT27_06645 [Permianibacter sp. IMCC34836]|uniref:hypothetical protein n=1 Tax=Permianibacter fluminis TaxID=2738515 RepID=UPI001552DF33|nr:hypothetical protein [Permianibacter fluminis]NQD36698.1 hypothetical protein [Permianibacter fluminis]
MALVSSSRFSSKSASSARARQLAKPWVAWPLLLLTLAWFVVSGWLYGQMPNKDWLPIVLSGFGVIVALLVAVWTIGEQRRQLTLNFAMKLWEVWSEPEMIRCREMAWEALRSEPFNNGKKRIGHLRTDKAEAYKSIARVDHFFADLHDFIAAGMLDRGDATVLFRDTLQAYYCHLLFVDIADGFVTGDGTGESHQLWFSEKVLGLATQLQLETSEDFQRYRHVFNDNVKAASDSQQRLVKKTE